MVETEKIAVLQSAADGAEEKRPTETEARLDSLRFRFDSIKSSARNRITGIQGYIDNPSSLRYTRQYKESTPEYISRRPHVMMPSLPEIGDMDEITFPMQSFPQFGKQRVRQTGLKVGNFEFEEKYVVTDYDFGYGDRQRTFFQEEPFFEKSRDSKFDLLKVDFTSGSIVSPQPDDDGTVNITRQLKDVVNDAAKDLRVQYEHFTNDLLEETDIVHEMQHIYVERVIKPLARIGLDGRENSEAIQAEFSDMLDAYLALPDDQTEEKNRMRDKIQRFSADTPGLPYVDIFGDAPKTYVQLFVAGAAASEIRTMRDMVEQYGQDHPPTDDFYLPVRNWIDVRPAQYARQSDLAIKLNNAVNGEPELQSTDWWDALRKSETVQNIFGDLVTERDAQIHKKALQDALDGKPNAVRKLSSYPSPDTIRTIMLLTVADEIDSNNNSREAVAALNRMKERDDWDEVYAEALGVYPELARAVSAVPKHVETYVPQPALRDRTKFLALATLEDASAPTQLKVIAMEGLPNEVLEVYLADRGIISREDAAILYQAEATLDRKVKALPTADAYLAGGLSAFREHVRRAVKNALTAEAHHPDELAFRQTVVSRLTRLASEIVDHQGNLDHVGYLTATKMMYITEDPNYDLDLLFAVPNQVNGILGHYAQEAQRFFLDNVARLVGDEQDIEYMAKFFDTFGNDAAIYLPLYADEMFSGTMTKETRERFFKKYEPFILSNTAYDHDRMQKYNMVKYTQIGATISELTADEGERARLLFDYTCFSDHMEGNKLAYFTNLLESGTSGETLNAMMQYLRWLPDGEIAADDTRETLAAKYTKSLDTIRDSFAKVFPNTQALLESNTNYANLDARYAEICSQLNLETRKITTNGVSVSIPVDFIGQFRAVRKEDPDVLLLPYLTEYLIDQVTQRASAYTVEDILFTQIGETEDRTGNRRSRYSVEQLFTAMESNVNASLRTWDTAIKYQRERPDSPLFIIANERTGPGDVAAEYLPSEFAERFGIEQKMQYEELFASFKEHEALISQLYERYMQGEDVADQLPAELMAQLHANQAIIPIYRLKIPSSLDRLDDEPEGIDTVANFLKLTTIVGGRTLFMDESTRPVPRSMESLNGYLARHANTVGDVTVRAFGKVNGASGWLGSSMDEKQGDPRAIEIGFIDPWESNVKPITDDSEGFVPEVDGSGVVEIVKPSRASVSHSGFGTIQDYWKSLIANEVAQRFDEFHATGMTPEQINESKEFELSQQRLKELAYGLPYQAVVLDLDGTSGSRGRYHQEIIEKIKTLAGNGVEVVIATARSQEPQQLIDFSTTSFVDQLGDLTEVQKQHIHMATDNASFITTLSEPDAPRVSYPLNSNAADLTLKRMHALFPNLETYRTEGAIVVKGFDPKDKKRTERDLSTMIQFMDVSLTVTSDSKRAIHIRNRGQNKGTVLHWLESQGIDTNEVAKFGDSPAGNDGPMLIGRGAFNVGTSRDGTIWTIHSDENGGGPAETNAILDRVKFQVGDRVMTLEEMQQQATIADAEIIVEARDLEPGVISIDSSQVPFVQGAQNGHQVAEKATTITFIGINAEQKSIDDSLEVSNDNERSDRS